MEDDHMISECRIEMSGTIFRFFVSRRDDDGDESWTDARFSVENWCFNYKMHGSNFQVCELKSIRDSLAALLNDELKAKQTMEFIEPDVQIILKPKHDVREDGIYAYVREGYEIEDISALFVFYPLFDGELTEQHYVMPLYRDEIEQLVDYMRFKLHNW